MEGGNLLRPLRWVAAFFRGLWGMVIGVGGSRISSGLALSARTVITSVLPPSRPVTRLVLTRMAIFRRVGNVLFRKCVI